MSYTITMWLRFITRIIAAGILGGLSSMERKDHERKLTMQGYIMIACASAVFMIISKYSFADLTDAGGNFLFGTKGVDPSRVAASVIGGVGFACAGVVSRREGVIDGLMTAATLWAVCSIGLSAGAGMWPVAVSMTVIVIVMRLFVAPLANRIGSSHIITLTILMTDDTDFEERLHYMIGLKNGRITDIGMERDEQGWCKFSLRIVSSDKITYEAARDLAQAEGGRLLSYNSWS